MFTVDLLQGRGLPSRISPMGLILRAAPFVAPVLVAAGLWLVYLGDGAALAAGQASIQDMEAEIQSCEEHVAHCRRIRRQIGQIQEDLQGVAKVLQSQRQWSDLLQVFVQCMPDQIILRQMDLKRDMERRRVADPKDPGKTVYETVIRRKLTIEVYGGGNGDTDAAVQDYLTRLKQDPLLAPPASEIRVASRKIERIESQRQAIYQIECLMGYGQDDD